MLVNSLRDLTPKAAARKFKRVLHVSSAHRASDGRISWKEAETLAAAGYAVTVLALDRAKGTTLPGGPEFIEWGPPVSRLRRFLIRLPWLLGYCIKHKYDVYHLHDPELILLGFALKLLGRCVVYDVHESYPMVILDRDWIPRPLRPVLSRAWRSIESAFVRCTDMTVTAHDTIKQQFRGGKVIAVHNFPIQKHFAAAKPTPMSQRPYRVIYHGDLTEQRGLISMVSAIAEVDTKEDPVLRLGGSLSPTLQKKIAAMAGIKRTTYLGWLNRAQLADELGQARAGLVLLHPTHNYMVIRPNKLYEYMAAGLPVIASDFSHWHDVVASAECGILVDPLDPSAIARAIEYLFAHPDEAAAMGERGRRVVADRYNWERERDELVAGYDQLFGQARESWSQEADAKISPELGRSAPTREMDASNNILR